MEKTAQLQAARPHIGNTSTFGKHSQGRRNDRICRRLLSKELTDNPGNHISHVLDVGDNPFYWKYDIDLLCVSEQLRYSAVEIKADNYPPQKGVKNLFLEFIANDSQYLASAGKRGTGCILFTKSDYLIFYFIKLDTYLVVPTVPLQEFVRKHLGTEKYKVKGCATTGEDGKVLYSSYGMIVPVPDIMNGIAGCRLLKSQYRYQDIAKEVA